MENVLVPGNWSLGFDWDLDSWDLVIRKLRSADCATHPSKSEIRNQKSEGSPKSEWGDAFGSVDARRSSGNQNVACTTISGVETPLFSDFGFRTSF
jgi:hypothetical protein